MRWPARGVLFNRAYCNQAVCSPSRNALLTGLRPTTLGIYDLATNFRVSRPDAVTLPQYFKQHGYRTEGMGKIFHHGHGNHEDDASWSVPYWTIGCRELCAEGTCGCEQELARGGFVQQRGGAKAKDLAKGAAYESADVPDNMYPDGQMADEAIKRLKSAAKTPEQPFFLAVGFVKPHLPFCAEEVLGFVRSRPASSWPSGARRRTVRRRLRRRLGRTAQLRRDAREGARAGRRCAEADPRLPRRSELCGRAGRARARGAR